MKIHGGRNHSAGHRTRDLAERRTRILMFHTQATKEKFVRLADLYMSSVGRQGLISECEEV